MQPQTRKLVLTLGGLAAFTAVLVLGANWALTLVPAAAPPPASGPLPVPDVDVRIEGGAEGDGATYQIQKGAVDRRPLRYTINGFIPERIAIQATDDIGCLITVINQTDIGLRIGVNPHAAAGDPGADYSVIPPGETGILDVRYPGFEAMALHAHHNPAHGFSVDYGQGCR